MMMSLKNIRVLLVLTLAMQTGCMFGMMAWLRPGCRKKNLIALALPSAASRIMQQLPITEFARHDAELALAVLRERALVADRIRQQLPAAEFLKRDGDAWLINRELEKPKSASTLLACIKRWGRLEPQTAPIHSYGSLGDIISGAADGMFSTWYGHGHWDSEFLLNIIATELKHSDYRSFFHGASGQLRVLCDLQKALAKEHGIVVPEAFEFLRARIGRSNLKSITAQQYVENWRYVVDDHRDPWRTELLSVDRSLCHSHYPFHSNYSYGALNMYDWVVQALSVYELPMPYDGKTFNTLFPAASHGLLIHILLRDKCADRLVYRATNFGHPCDAWRMPDKDHEFDDYFFAQEYRIILDPTIFDEPNSDVQMRIHQKLSSEERKQIDQFIAQLIHDAKELKRQRG